MRDVHDSQVFVVKFKPTLIAVKITVGLGGVRIWCQEVSSLGKGLCVCVCTLAGICGLIVLSKCQDVGNNLSGGVCVCLYTVWAFSV